MTLEEFRKLLIKLSRLAHRAYWEGREHTHDYLIHKISDRCEEYPEHVETLESMGMQVQIH